MIVYKCDLCGEIRECVQKEIENREYDICLQCWKALEEKLEGKGRPKTTRETIYLPLQPKQQEPQDPKPLPGMPPTIWSSSFLFLISDPSLGSMRNHEAVFTK